MFYLVLSKNKNRIPFNYNKVHNPKSKIPLAKRKNFFEKKSHFRSKLLFTFKTPIFGLNTVFKIEHLRF